MIDVRARRMRCPVTGCGVQTFPRSAAGERRPAGRRLRAHPSRPAGPACLSPLRCGGTGDRAATATMSHRAGPDRHDVTSCRSPGLPRPAWRGTPERQVTPGAHDASPLTRNTYFALVRREKTFVCFIGVT